MKKIVLPMLLAIGINLLLFNCAKAESSGFNNPYLNYTNVKYPISVEKEGPKYSENIKNVSLVQKNDVDLSQYKKGMAESSNVLGLVDMGDAGIFQAARNGNIHKIHYVDRQCQGFSIYGIGVYNYKTIVYGE